MARGYPLSSGGGGTASSDVTASKSDVLKGKTTVTSDSNDEIVEGTLELTGNAGTGDVLSGKTFYTTDPKSKQTGTLALSGDAAAGNVLYGKTFYDTDAKTRRTGTMNNRGAVNQTLGINGNYTIPAGYHNGSGKVTQSVATQGGSTITPGTSQKTAVAANRYVTGNIIVAGDANLIAANIKQGVNIFGVVGTCKELTLYNRGRNVAGFHRSNYTVSNDEYLLSDSIGSPTGFKANLRLISNSSYDFSSYNTINMELNVIETNSSADYLKWGIYPDEDMMNADRMVYDSWDMYTGTRTISMPVSSETYSGPIYMAVSGAQSDSWASSGPNVGTYLKIYRIWFS